MAGLALGYALVCLLVFSLLALSWVRGRPLTTPLQIRDPDLTLLAAGEEVHLLPGGATLLVSRELVRAVAGLNLALFGSAALLWGLAGWSLLGKKAWGRILGFTLFVATTLVGLFNLALGVGFLLAGGGLPALSLAWRPLVWIGVTLVLLPAAAAAALLGKDVRGRFRSSGPELSGSFSFLMAGLTLHFLMVGLILLGAVLAWPESLGQVVLVGPWFLNGWPARLVSGLVGAGHLVAGCGFLGRKAAAYHLALWMNALLASLMAVSALTGPAAALTDMGGGLLPSQIRFLLWAVAVLTAGMVLGVRATRRQFRPLARDRSGSL
ncbi:MAG: hypothetical protein ACE5HD_01310 [Acidobacteriota bacterium]